jgi:predicted XRE-type DNA-binding protein
MSPKGRSVFYDLGFDDAEAAELTRKSDLMIHLVQYVRRHGLTQAKAAEVFGVSQPRVSDLKNGKLSTFSLDELVRMYEATGSRIRLVFDEDTKQEGTVLQRLEAKGEKKPSKRARAG